MSDFSIKQGNLTPHLKQTITLPAAVNLTGATAQFVYRLPDGDSTSNYAAINSRTPTAAAATSIELEYAWAAGDVDEPGVYQFEWKLTLGDASTLTVPSKAPTVTEPERLFQTFEVVPVI